jgi:DNA-binding transcriptional ArsR family regulator
VTDVFTAIAEPTRRRLLDALRPGEAPVGRLAAELGLAQPAVSKHLRVLLEAGLVEVRSDAQRRLYRVRPESLRTVLQWLEPYRAMWAAHLDDLERHLDAEGADTDHDTDQREDR